MKRTEYFLGEGNHAMMTLEKAVERRDIFPSEHIEMIRELVGERINVSSSGTHNNIYFVIIIQLTYYPNRLQ